MQPNRSPYAFFTTIILLMLLATTLLTGCAPRSNPTPTQPPTPVASPLPAHCTPINVSTDGGQTVITLPDGSQIYMAENTEIDITPVGYCPGNDQLSILLKQGKVAINSLLPAGKMVVITSPNGYIGQVSKTGLVTFDPNSHVFTLACTNGTCTLAAKAEKLTSLGCGESGFLDTYGNFSGPFNVDPSTLVQFGDWLQPLCPPARTSTPKPVTKTPTSTNTPTLDMGATATSYCATFMKQFPMTPCPTLKKP